MHRHDAIVWRLGLKLAVLTATAFLPCKLPSRCLCRHCLGPGGFFFKLLENTKHTKHNCWTAAKQSGYTLHQSNWIICDHFPPPSYHEHCTTYQPLGQFLSLCHPCIRQSDGNAASNKICHPPSAITYDTVAAVSQLTVIPTSLLLLQWNPSRQLIQKSVWMPFLIQWTELKNRIC